LLSSNFINLLHCQQQEIPAAHLQKITLTVTPTASTYASPYLQPANTKVVDNKNNLEWETIIHSGSDSSPPHDTNQDDSTSNNRNSRNGNGGLTRLAAFADSFRRQQQLSGTDSGASLVKFPSGESEDDREGSYLKQMVDRRFNSEGSNNNGLNRRGVAGNSADVILPLESTGNGGGGVEAGNKRKRPDWFTGGAVANQVRNHQLLGNEKGSDATAAAAGYDGMEPEEEAAHLAAIRNLVMHDLQEIMNAAGW
jgi:hypothetical protein